MLIILEVPCQPRVATAWDSSALRGVSPQQEEEPGVARRGLETGKGLHKLWLGRWGGGQTEGRLSPLPLHPAPHPAAGSGGPKAGPLCWSPGDHIWDLVVVYCSPQSAAGQRSDSESDRPGFDPSCFALLRPQLTPGRAKRLPSLGASLASPGTRGRAPVSW